MTDPRDYKLELSGADPRAADERANTAESARPFLSVHFACCGVYQRVYRDLDATRYEGRCPRCARPVRFVVGAGGTDSRSFIVE
jgi:hypothetical protein